MTFSIFLFYFVKNVVFYEVCFKSVGCLYNCFLILFAKYDPIYLAVRQIQEDLFLKCLRNIWSTLPPTVKQSCPWIKVCSNMTQPGKQTMTNTWVDLKFLWKDPSVLKGHWTKPSFNCLWDHALLPTDKLQKTCEPGRCFVYQTQPNYF